MYRYMGREPLGSGVRHRRCERMAGQKGACDGSCRTSCVGDAFLRLGEPYLHAQKWKCAMGGAGSRRGGGADAPPARYLLRSYLVTRLAPLPKPATSGPGQRRPAPSQPVQVHGDDIVNRAGPRRLCGGGGGARRGVQRGARGTGRGARARPARRPPPTCRRRCGRRWCMAGNGPPC